MSKKATQKSEADELKELGSSIEIEPIKQQVVSFVIEGTAPYLQQKFSAKAAKDIEDRQKLGELSKNSKKRKPRDFDADYENSKHVSTEGWLGIPAMAIKAAMVSACKLTGVPMTRAKLLFNALPDGFDNESFDPLIRIEGKCEMHKHHVRIKNVCDIRARAIFPKWRATVRIQYDRSCIGPDSILNLLYRAGVQVGIGEGRPDSKQSVGMGLGTFSVSVAKNGK